MSQPKVAILGASGFVGATMVERLFFDPAWRDRFDFTAFIHSYGNAARIGRLPIKIEPLDILDAQQVEASLSSYDYVVNCTRGDSILMLDGMKNIVKALQKIRPQRFVHMGSVAIYGPDPAEASAREDAPPGAQRSAYGDVKAKQDEMVFNLHEKGVPAMVLCPSNIGGPYSGLIIDVAKRLIAGEIVLVDGGQTPTNIVHVDNLVQAILTAVTSEKGWGELYFVNETEATTWKQFFDDMVAILGIPYEFGNVPREEVLPYVDEKSLTPRAGFRTQVGTLVSRDFRNRLAVFPAFRVMDDAAGKMFRRLNPRLQERLRQKLRKPITIGEAGTGPGLGHKLITTQIRRVYHSPEKIMRDLGYRPLLDYRQGMATTQKWLEFANLIPSRKSIMSR